MEGVPYRSTMNKKIDKAALASRILSLEGLSSEDKSALLELLNEQKRYGLVWENSPEEVEALLREKLPVLTEDTTKHIPSTDENSPNHIVIEGDNYPALVALQYAYEGKVDVIYIDPPYNTGKKDDFIFNDCYVDKEDSFRHSKWLSFMEKRLRLAKKLLSEKGVIFISIDDNEQANLKILCDEVFGQHYFVTDIIWRSADSSNNDAKQFSADYNNTLVYSKCDGWQPIKIARTEENNAHYKNPDNDPNGPWFSGNLSSPNPRQNLMFDIISPQGYVIHAPKNGWRWSYETMQGYIENGAIVFVDNGTRLIKKTYLKDQEGIVPSNIWWDIEVTGHNRNAKYELKKIFPEYKTSEIFKTPKPTKFIKRILELSTTKNSIILDFFAGAGTTLHSSMLLNIEDGGQRTCILVNNNEEGICSNFTYERNKRVIQGYTTPKGQQMEGLKNNNLRYYKVDFVDREKTAANQKELMKASTDLLCIKENLYQEETSFEGLKLHPQIARCFSDGVEGGKMMLIIYEPNAIPALVMRIEQMSVDKENKLKVYVMAEGQYPYTEDFESVLSKVELQAMPHALYQAMRQVLPPPAEVENTEPDMEVSDEEADGSIYKSEEQ